MKEKLYLSNKTEDLLENFYREIFSGTSFLKRYELLKDLNILSSVKNDKEHKTGSL